MMSESLLPGGDGGYWLLRTWTEIVIVWGLLKFELERWEVENIERRGSSVVSNLHMA